MSYELETAIELKTANQMVDLLDNPPLINIKVVGVGGAGCNSINRMLQTGVALDGVEFIAINTDKSCLSVNKAPKRICIGPKTTHFWGAGMDPNKGQQAAEESVEDIRMALEGADMIFLTAGMGGGTGTGASPVVARVAKELGILTVAVVTKPFKFEGARKMMNAEIGLENLSRVVDAYVVIPNQKLVEKFTKAGVLEAFKIADDVLSQGVIGLAEIIVRPMLINVDYMDVRAVLEKAGIAHIGVGKAHGQNRILDAIKQAICSPLIETSISGAKGLILCVRSSENLTLAEMAHYNIYVHDLVHEDCDIKWCADIDAKYGDSVEVLIIASRFAPDQEPTRERVSQLTPKDFEKMKPVEPVPEKPKKNVPPFWKRFKNF